MAAYIAETFFSREEGRQEEGKTEEGESEKEARVVAGLEKGRIGQRRRTSSEREREKGERKENRTQIVKEYLRAEKIWPMNWAISY